MIAAPAQWPTWFLVVMIAPTCLCAASLVCGWWPATRLQWRFFGTVLACFTAVCILMICVLHKA